MEPVGAYVEPKPHRGHVNDVHGTPFVGRGRQAFKFMHQRRKFTGILHPVGDFVKPVIA